MVCDAKPSHHRSQMVASQFHGVCLCTTGEDEVEEAAEKGEGGRERATVSLDMMQQHVRNSFFSEILRSVVRSLRTTAPKCLTPSFTVCVCTTREDEVEGGGEKGRGRESAAVSVDVMQKHVRKCFTLRFCGLWCESLRTTDPKCSPPSFTVCAFAPPQRN